MDPLSVRKLPITRAEGDNAPILAKLATETPVNEFDPMTGRILPQVLLSDGFRTESSQVPLLDSHDRASIDSILGSIRNIGSQSGAVVGELHFDSGERGQSARTKVTGGHLTDVSVGFMVNKKRYIEPGGTAKIGGRSFRAGDEGLNVATEWTAKEGSLTPVGADYAAQVMRSFQESNNNPTTKKMETVTEPTEEFTRAALVTENEELETARKNARKSSEEKERVGSIEEMGARYGIPKQDIDIAIVSNDSADKFRGFVANVLAAKKEVQEKEDAQKRLHSEIGMTKRDMRQFSITESIARMAQGKGGVYGNAALEGIAKECHDHLSDEFQRATGAPVSPKSILLPANVTRANTVAGDGTEGGFLVPTEQRSIIDYCAEALVMGRVGATVLSGLSSDVAFPRLTAGLTATWPGETGNATTADLVFGQLLMSPSRVTAETAYSLLLMTQASEDVEAMARREIGLAIARGIDLAALYGAGSGSAEPLGLLNQSGTQPLTFGTGDPTWSSVLEFDQLIEESNCSNGPTSDSQWLMSSNVKKVWQSTEKVATQGGFLADPIDGAGRFSNATANGAPIVYHNNVGLGERVIKGAWENLLVGLWGALELVVDPYTGATAGSTRVVASAFADVGVRHAAAFVISTDKGDGTNV